MWGLETGKSFSGPFAIHTGGINSIAYSPDGRYIASGSDDESVRIWDVETGHSEVFTGHTSEVRSVAFSPDSSYIVSSDGFNEIRVWSVGTTSKALVTADRSQFLSFKTIIDPSKWTLDNDGWILGTHDELLLWVPPGLRPTLCFYPNIAILNNEFGFSTALDFSHCAYGEHWQECFNPYN